MTIEDIFKLKGIVDNSHYVVLKTVDTLATTFKSIKKYSIKIINAKSQKIIYEVSLNSNNKERAFKELEDKLIITLLKENGNTKYRG